MVEIIDKYFSQLTDQQSQQMDQLLPLYTEWNSQINVISRKDIDNLYERHVLHSLAIAKWISFKPGTKIMDIGCGGGFPSIPLAILFPEVSFHCVDSINKKLKVINAIVAELGLENIKTTHSRAEEIKDRYDYVINRAVAPFTKLLSWTRNNISAKQRNAIPNGMISLKGGDLSAELSSIRKKEYYEVTPLSDYFEEEFFETKSLIYIQLG
jgi:16S rRNA (guanine527-N7)-methyltransferase